MSMTKAQGWDTFEAKWDQWVTKSNVPNATQGEIEDAFKLFAEAMMYVLPQVNQNHPGPPPPRIRPAS